MRFEFLPVGGGAFDDPETIRFSLRIGVLMQLNILPVGTGVLDGPESNKFCFLNGYWYVATRKANVFSSRTVGDAGPYRQKFKPHRYAHWARNIVVFLQGRDSPSEKFL